VKVYVALSTFESGTDDLTTEGPRFHSNTRRYTSRQQELAFVDFNISAGTYSDPCCCAFVGSQLNFLFLHLAQKIRRLHLIPTFSPPSSPFALSI
jgi:hypothetical protein